jgi:hypothetical protein
MTVWVVAFQVIFWREKGWRRRYSARRLRPALSWAATNPLRPRAFGGKGAEGMKKEIPSSQLKMQRESVIPAANTSHFTYILS